MAYSLKADLLTEISEDELIGLTDDESAGIVNEARVTAAIAKGDGIADIYYGKVVPVPIAAPVPAVVKQNSITMGIYFLYSRRSAVPEIRAQNYKDVMKHLGDISTGKASLPPVTEADVGDQIKASGPEEEATGEDRTFTKDKMGSY